MEEVVRITPKTRPGKRKCRGKDKNRCIVNRKLLVPHWSQQIGEIRRITQLPDTINMILRTSFEAFRRSIWYRFFTDHEFKPDRRGWLHS